MLLVKKIVTIVYIARYIKGFNMKNSIKVLLISLTLCFVFVFSACSQGVATTLNGSYFLQNAGNVSIIGNIDEENVYSVSFKKAENSGAADVGISLENAEGFNVYTTRLKNTTYNGADCYLLETELKTKIGYVLNGEPFGTFENYVKSKVYFLSVSNKLKPLYSETEANANSPVTDKNGKYSVVNLNYKFTITYSDNAAIVDFTKKNGDFGIPEGKREYKISDGYYFDNTTMLFMPRAVKLTDSSSLSFSSIDAISGINRKMIMRSDANKPSENLVFSKDGAEENSTKGEYFINKKKEFLSEDKKSQVIPCRIVNFNVSGTFSGSAIKCWYADVSVEPARARLIKMETIAPYSLGTFTYIINKTTVEG